MPLLKEQDTDWKRYLLNRPCMNPLMRASILSFRLFWPLLIGYSRPVACSPEIDTVHWFTGLPHPRSVVANGGIYLWKDGRQNWDTMTAVFDYGPLDDPAKGFQVQYSSRFTNSAGGVKELYYSNGGMIDMDKQTVTPEGGMQAREAAAMGLKANLLRLVFRLSKRPNQSPMARTRAAILRPRPTCATGWSVCARARHPMLPSKLVTATPSPFA